MGVTGQEEGGGGLWKPAGNGITRGKVRWGEGGGGVVPGFKGGASDLLQFPSNRHPLLFLSTWRSPPVWSVFAYVHSRSRHFLNLKRNGFEARCLLFFDAMNMFAPRWGVIGGISIMLGLGKYRRNFWNGLILFLSSNQPVPSFLQVCFSCLYPTSN